eukprot:IDg7377t1
MSAVRPLSDDCAMNAAASYAVELSAPALHGILAIRSTRKHAPHRPAAALLSPHYPLLFLAYHDAAHLCGQHSGVLVQ